MTNATTFTRDFSASIAAMANAVGAVREISGGLEISYTPDADLVTNAASAAASYAFALNNIHAVLKERQGAEPTMRWIVEEGRSYYKIVSESATRPGSHRSGWAFISKSNGDLYRAASFTQKGSLLGNLLDGRPVHHLPTF